MPRTSSTAIVISIIIVSANATEKPMNQPIRRAPPQHDLGDLVGDAVERVPGRDDRFGTVFRHHPLPSSARMSGLGIAHRREVGRARLRPDLAEQLVVARLGLELRHARLGVVDVAERDRLRRAHLLAGGRDLAVTDAAARLPSRRCARG
jgi:hypothetical protein